MKPIKIEFQAFGPYSGHEIVDFTKLASNGLFLICGKTGTGKTTILDAMTFALYGKSSGHGRDNFDTMRCTRALGDKATFVIFEFENNGEYYLFERRLEKKRINFSKSYNAMRKTETGKWEVIFENAKATELNNLAEEIIGLDYDQFRQVIVLPQGQFEKFLTSNSDEKEKILTSIFGEEKWQQIAENFYNEAKERKDALTKTKDRIQNSLIEEKCESIPQLKDIVSAKKEERRKLEKNYQEANYDRIIDEQDKLIKIANRFKDLHEAEKKLRELEDNKDRYGAMERQCDASKRAEKVRPLIYAADKAEEIYKKKQEEKTNAEQDAKEAKKAAEEAAGAYAEHIKSEPEIERKKTLKIQYEGKQEAYKQIDIARNELDKLTKEKEKIDEKVAKTKGLLNKSNDKIIEIKNEYNNLQKAHEKLLDKYIAGIAGELAAGLEEGTPCPVCGSISHPAKAVKADDSVTKAEVDQKKKEADKKYNELNDAENAQKDVAGQFKEEDAAAEAINQKISAAEAKLETTMENLVQGINSLEELNEAIKSIENEIKKYDETKKNLDKKKTESDEYYRKLTKNQDIAANAYEDAMERYSEAEVDVRNSLDANGFASADEARQALLDEKESIEIENKIKTYTTDKAAEKKNLEKLEHELKDKQEPDSKSCEEKKKEANNKIEEYNLEKGRLNSEIKRLTGKLETLEEGEAELDVKLSEAEDDLGFAKSLRGDAGIGLQRYVLGIMFSSVIAAANNMLEMVHGGRYRLYRSDEKEQNSRKKGLELNVFDKNSGEHEGRLVSTLSGGEKFLVSLALSIGMSTVAQKSGIRIEALFIDEGFGSLDEDSIGDAMSVLNSIREANGIVGIISHVQLLQERIATKLKVEESEQGSHIVKAIG